MRPRALLWLLLSMLCFAGAYYFWHLGERWAGRGAAAPPPAKTEGRMQNAESRLASLPPFQLLTQPGTLNSPPVTESPAEAAAAATNRFALRLSNTDAPLRELQRSDQAILLENALLDTTREVPAIPGHLRAQGDPGAYFVQCRGPIDNAFRSLLRSAGAVIVSYIPNNAYLVRATAGAAEQLAASPQTQAVLPYEPYYKLKPSLLRLAVAQDPLPANSVLNVLLFADAREETRAELQKLGARMVGDEESSPFGPVLRVRAAAESLAALASLPGVQSVEWALSRAPANDFSRARIGVATDVLATNNYLDLTGSNVLVAVNDSGVDATHPDLSPRVFADSTNTLIDPNGHGTHVAGIIASSGGQSATVSNAAGPDGPYSGTNNQFRGKAPAASLFALPVDVFTRPFTDGGTLFRPSDSYLQQTAARTNALISNNSWNYVGNDSQTYDIHAASYDAAVRDALPTVSGSQPLLVVFAAGNNGGGNNNGTGGRGDRIQSPATAKNVITVGAIELMRNVTNEAWQCVTIPTNTCTTNQPWVSLTDADDEVAGFSGRGPVGINIEGDNGRFKPDLVAPGTFVISTKSAQWDTNAYYNPTGHIFFIYRDVFIPTNGLYLDSIFVPENAVQLNLSVLPNTNSPDPFPDLPMYINPTTWPTNTDPVVGTNRVSVPPDGGLDLTPVGQDWYYGIGNQTTQTVVCDLVTDIVVTNNPDNRLEVLAGMNDGLGPYYRYESGSSMAAADVSGTLALMQEFFTRPPLSRTNSPALMKALLINGARSVGSLYDFNVRALVNFQGWGLVNLPTTLPGSLTNQNATTNAMVMLDQSPTNALATGQSRTYKISLSAQAQRQPLRATLVWTDPPGSPIASTKLVNDLDLVVTNLDATNYVYFGNDIGEGSDFNQIWRTNTVPNLDTVNNVENVYLSPSLGINSQLSTNYSITVIGRRVNVNAVTAQTNNVCQDYALVISSGDGLFTNAIALDASAGIIYSNQPLLTVITNSFANSPGYAGGILFNQRAGASPQLLGTNSLFLTNEANAVLTLGVTNQWHFYVITNDTGFTNAAFLTFLPANLAVPRMGVFEPDAERAVRPEADIDLYVAPPGIPNNAALTNLDPAVVEAATKSLSRGGTETIVYSNATDGVYYLGVKAEDQQAAEYAIVGVFSREPFGSGDTNGMHLVGIPVWQAIPDGSPQAPGVATIVAINVSSMMVRRVIVTNVVAHELTGDLLGVLAHGADFSVLNNHTCVIEPATEACQLLTSYIYDDSDELNVGIDPGFPYANQQVQPTDKPGGNLNVFGGKDGEGQWILSMVDNATNHAGTNILLGIFLEQQPDIGGQGITVTLAGGACRNDFIEVPPNATSLTITVAVVSATGPVDYSIEVCPLSGGNCESTVVTNAVGGAVTIDQTDLPPLHAGTYRVRVCNLAQAPITVNIRAIFGFSETTLLPILSSAIPAPVAITDDAVTLVYLTNNFHNFISSVDVGLLIRDPRVSDLAITLVSPRGTRILLFENRGAGSTNGLGTFSLSTNYLMEPFYTNDFDLAPVGLYAPGAMFEGWSVLSNSVEVLDDFTCLCLSNHVLALFDGAVSNSLPTTNALLVTNSYPYTLSYRVNHLPWLEGMVTWWPLDFDGTDIFGGLDGLLLGNVVFPTGKVDQAYSGDGIATRMVVPHCPELDLGLGRGFTIEGWINPTPLWVPVATVMANGFENATPSLGIPTGSIVSGWRVDAGDIDVLSSGTPGLTFAVPDSGTNCVEMNGSVAGTISTNLSLVVGHTYRLSFAYGRNPDSVGLGIVAQAVVSLNGSNVVAVAPAMSNSWSNVQWQHTSVVFTASSALTQLEVRSLTAGRVGVMFDSFDVTELVALPSPPAPLAEWYDPAPPTNQSPLGVQFWLSGLPGTNAPGALWASIWDTNQQPHVFATVTNAVTNGGWQHVALTYATNGNTAILYTNGQSAATVQFPTPFVPRTAGNLYLGFDPTVLPAPIRYPNFSSITGLNLVGTATQVGSILRLTPAAQQVIGNAWATTKQFCAAGFSTSYQCRWSNLGNRGGDEIIFTVQNDSPTSPALYSSFGSGTNFVSVFLNTRAFPTPFDVSGNSIAIVTNNAYVTQRNLTPLGINLKDGAVHTVRVNFDGTGFDVWLDNIHVLTNVLVPGLTMATDSQGYGWVGFSAYCGLAHSDQDILNWTFGGPTPGTSFSGGLDEFSVYDRALTPCEVNAIYSAGSGGKYGTNVLVCPVVTEVTLSNTPAGIQVFTFTNGLSWVTNGPHWETNLIAFSTSTNPTPIVVRGLNPYDAAETNAGNNLNAVVDDFVLSTLAPKSFDGLLHFTENTNLATIPIKFAPAPFSASNFPPVLIFSNDFQYATAGVYQAGATILGGTNSPDIGIRDWTVATGSVTVVSNAGCGTVPTNWLAMATGAVQCLLPTSPGHRYQLSYSLRGPCAVGWWDGSIEPLSRRAQDIISGNNGAFINTATVSDDGYVNAADTLFFPGVPWPPTNNPWYAFAPKVELGDPANLHFTNSFTIEGWINSAPAVNTNDIGVATFQQIFFRGDSRNCRDPYWLALQFDPTWEFDVVFHVESENSPGCGVSLVTTNHPVKTNTWHHIAAVFESNVQWTNNAPWPTNQLRLYLDGLPLTNVFLADPVFGALETTFTGESPFGELEADRQPGITIGNSSRYDNSAPFCGFLDELSVYARALTEPEIAAIAAAGTAGKADRSVTPGQSLAKLRVSLDGAPLDLVYGDNARWTTHSREFTALRTNMVLTLESLLPGTLLADVTLTELPPELFYLPEVSLAGLSGEDAFGIWTLEIWDNRAGPDTNSAELVEWQLTLGFAPSNPPPVITLSHGISYTNSLPANGIQYFTVPVPQWALFATNVLQFADQVNTVNPLPVTVLFNQTNFPTTADFPLVGPLVSAGFNTLSTNTTPPLVVGQTYYLALTNPNPVGVTFALGVWYDITTLTNCQMLVSNLVGPAGIPRYFQFDVPADGAPPDFPPQAVSFWLSSADCNLKVVLREHLPLPDLNHYDYISDLPCTNDQIIMLVTNTTPFPIQTNRWYVGVFNSSLTNASFDVQACCDTNAPGIISLTNGIPFDVPTPASAFAAPPGPPQRAFFDFFIPNAVGGALFELYDLSGDGDLLLEWFVLPTMPPYFETSFFPGRAPEQIVLRTDPNVPAHATVSDLRGHWYLGVWNHEDVPLGYTIRAVTTDRFGLLVSGQPLRLAITPLAPPHGSLLSWNSVVGERYLVQYTPTIAPVAWTNIGTITATTTLTTFEVPPGGFYRVVQVFSFHPRLFIELWPVNLVRISWPTVFTDYTLQYSTALTGGVWANVPFPPATGVFTVGGEFVVFDPIGATPRYYRLIK